MTIRQEIRSAFKEAKNIVNMMTVGKLCSRFRSGGFVGFKEFHTDQSISFDVDNLQHDAGVADWCYEKQRVCSRAKFAECAPNVHSFHPSSLVFPKRGAGAGVGVGMLRAAGNFPFSISRFWNLKLSNCQFGAFNFPNCRFLFLRYWEFSNL